MSYSDSDNDDAMPSKSASSALTSASSSSSSSSSFHAPNNAIKNEDHDTNNGNNVNGANLASLIPYLQSHQNLINAQSAAESSSDRDRDTRPSSSTLKSEVENALGLNLNLNSILAPTVTSLIASTNTSASTHAHEQSAAATDALHNLSQAMLQQIATSALDPSAMVGDATTQAQTAETDGNGAMLPVITSATESVAYFILRSNNEENVRISMEKGVWATQPQNESVLNEAFEKCDKVLLFFSVCRSMHFQGLCQMTSRIGHHKSRSLWDSGFGPRSRAKWGGTFMVRWLRIYDLPFEQTNHISNPWNSNRPVKFSRDGQAAPGNVGAQIVHLFDVGVMEHGQGSAILRRPIQMENQQIALQKLFVDGRFVPATDMQTARSMIAMEQRQQQSQAQQPPKPSSSDTDHIVGTILSSAHANNADASQALNRLVASLQRQADENPGVNVLDESTIGTVAKLLGDLSGSNNPQLPVQNHPPPHFNAPYHAAGPPQRFAHAPRGRDRDRGYHQHHHHRPMRPPVPHPHDSHEPRRYPHPHAFIPPHERRVRRRSRSRSRDHRRSDRHRHRHHRSHDSHRRHKKRREKERAHAKKKRRRTEGGDEESSGSSDSSSSSEEEEAEGEAGKGKGEKESKRRRRRRSRHEDKDRRHRERSKEKMDSKDAPQSNEQENVINSLWKQIQLQQSLLSQNGLYNPVNANGSQSQHKNAHNKNGNGVTSFPSNRGGVY